MQLRRGDHIERTVERVRRAVEVDRADDPPGGGIANPDVAVFAAREIHAPAVRENVTPRKLALSRCA